MEEVQQDQLLEKLDILGKETTKNDTSSNPTRSMKEYVYKVQCWTYITDRAIFDPRFFLDFFYFLKNYKRYRNQQYLIQKVW